MTNITLSIEDEVYKKMRRYSEMKWSEYVRKCIQHRVRQLEIIDSADWDNSKFLADEELLSESWLSKEDDEAFSYLQ